MAVGVDVFFFLARAYKCCLSAFPLHFAMGRLRRKTAVSEPTPVGFVSSPSGEELTAAMRKVWLDLPWPDESGISSRSIVVDERNVGCLFSFGEVLM